MALIVLKEKLTFSHTIRLRAEDAEKMREILKERAAGGEMKSIIDLWEVLEQTGIPHEFTEDEDPEAVYEVQE